MSMADRIEAYLTAKPWATTADVVRALKCNPSTVARVARQRDIPLEDGRSKQASVNGRRYIPLPDLW